MISVQEAIDITLKNTPRQSPVRMDFQECLGKVLAEDIVSDIDMPPFHRSAMDGYALAAEDAQIAPARLRVVGFIPAGSYPKFEIKPGEAAKIMTGAPLPRGA
ncbi:MAG: molybdopterin molybdenumtransferase MoeA, partial [Calditrichaeota bacterium]